MSNNFIKIWFSYACQQLPDIAESCLFFSDESQESFSLIEATSEEFSQSKAVHESLQAAVSRRKAIVIQQPAKRQVSSSASVVTDINSKNLLVSAPLIINKQIIGVVCYEFKYKTPSPNYLEYVEAAILWLDCMSRLPIGAGSKNAESVLKTIAMALSQSQSSEAFMAVASELSARLHCERVSIGLVEHNDVRLHTISNSTEHVTRQNLVKCIEAAMLEAVDQQETLLYPPRANSYYSTTGG